MVAEVWVSEEARAEPEGPQVLEDLQLAGRAVREEEADMAELQVGAVVA